MPVSIGEIQGTITLRDEFSAVFERTQKQLQSAGDKAIVAGRKMTSAGIAMTKAITLPLVAIGGGSLKAFSTFDDAMNRSLAIMGDVSEEMRGKMADAARELPLVIRASAAESAAGFEFLARAGKTAEQSLALLPLTARFANAGLIDLALGTDLLTDAQSALGLSVKDTAQDQINMARVSDVLVRANSLANASVVQFSKSLTTKAGDSMRRFSQDVESGVAVLAAWADQGVKGELAGERYSIVLRDMTNKSIKNREAFKKNNIAVFDQTGKVRKLVDIIEDMEVAFAGMSDETRKATLLSLGFTFKSVAATSSLIGLSEKIRQYEKDLRSAGGATQEVSDNQMKSFAAQIIVVKNLIVDVGIELGSKLAPIIESKVIPVIVSVTAFLRRMVDKFGELPRGMQTTIGAIAALAASLGLLLVAAGAIVTTFGFVIGALGGTSAIAAIAGVTVAFGAIVAVIIGPKGIVEGFKTAISSAKKFWAETVKGRTFIANLTRVIAFDLVEGVKSAADVVKSASERFVKWTGLSKNLKVILSAVNEVIAKALKLYKFMADSVKFLTREIKIAIGGMAGFKASLQGIVAIMSIVNPEFGRGADKIDDWVSQAIEAAKAAEDLAIEIERDTVAVGEMDIGFAKLFSKWDQAALKAKALADKVKKLTDEEKKLIALQKVLTEVTERMTIANRKSAADLAVGLIVKARELDNTIVKMPVHITSLVASIKEIGKAADENSLSGLISEEILEIVNRIKEAEVARAEAVRQLRENSLGLTDSMKEQVAAALGLEKSVGVTLTKMQQFESILGAISGADGALGDIAKSIGQMVEGFKQVKASIGGKGEAGGLGAGLAGIAGGIDALAESAGLFKGPGGISKFGGKTEGDRSKEGAQIGQVIGAVIGSLFFGIGAVAGAAIGRVLGKIVGSFIKTGADTAEATVSQIADELTIQVTKEEGPLGRPIRALAEGVRDAFATLEAIIGGEVGIADFKIKIREEVVTAWVNGVKAKFGTIAEAIDFIVTESIRTAEFGEGVTSRFVTALQNTNLTTVEELEELLKTVAEIETIASGAGVVAQGFKVLGIEMKILEGVIAEAGLDAADAVLVQAFKVKQIRDAITDTAAGIIGVADVAGGISDLVQSAEEFNTGLEKITATRQAELEAAIAADASLAIFNESVGTRLPGEIEAGMDAIDLSFKGFNRGMRGNVVVTNAARINVESFTDALAEMPERIDIKKIQDAATVAAGGVATTLIDMIESVRGKGTLEARRMAVQEATFKIQLAAQIAQMQLFAQMTELFTANTRAMFQGLVDDGLKLLDDLNSGAASIGDQAQKASSGRGKARRAAEEEFSKSAERVTAILAGATEASFSFADSVRALRDQAKEGKVGVVELNQAIANLAELDVKNIAETWSDAVDSIRRSNLGNAVADIMSRAQVSIDEINARAEANQSAAAAALLIVSEGVQAEMRQLGEESLLALSGPRAKLREEIKNTVRDIKFMVRNVDELGLTLAQVANRIRSGIVPGLIEIGIREAERLGLDKEAARFRAMQADLELKVQLIQLLGMRQMLIAAGAFNESTQQLFDDVFELFNMGRDPIEIPPVDTTDTEESTESIGESWSGAADVVTESSTRMTDSFIILSSEFDKINRRFVRLSTNTITLTSEMSELFPVISKVTRKFGKLRSELTKLADIRFAGQSDSGFAHGSGGFRDFGTGSMEVLHGEEEIVTRSQGASVAEMVRTAIGSRSTSGQEMVSVMKEGLGALIERENDKVESRQEMKEQFAELIQLLEGDEARDRVGVEARPTFEG